MNDRRMYTRYDLDYTVQIVSVKGDLVLTALTTNLSDGGLRLPVPVESLPEDGEKVHVNLTLRRTHDTGSETYSIPATVVRSEPPDENGMAELALRFQSPLSLHLKNELSGAITDDLL